MIKDVNKQVVKRVLVVEDEADLRNIIVNFLVREGYEALPAQDGEEAKQHLATQNFALILSDANMPNCNGFQLHAWVRQNLPPTVKFVFFTSTPKPDDLTDYDGYYTKPFSCNDLLKVVESMLAAASGIPGAHGA